MTQYLKRSRNGDAAEYFTCFYVTRILNWPCRLINIDLGIDAELEILDDENKSHGDIVKIQIKSVESIYNQSKIHVYVDEEHVNYWKRYSNPVIICCVALKEQRIFWQTVHATQSYATSGASNKVTFCVQHNEMLPSSKEDISRIVSPPLSKNVDIYLNELKIISCKLDSPNTTYGDWEAIEDSTRQCEQVTELIKKIRALTIHFPWRISLIDTKFIEYTECRIQTIENQLGYCSNSLVEGM